MIIKNNAVKIYPSLDEIISYMEKTNVEDWCTEVCRSSDETKNCFFGHLFNMGGNDLWNMFEEAYATEYMIFPVNDGKNPNYPQETAKERVIAYLKDLRDGKNKKTWQLMEETI